MRLSAPTMPLFLGSVVLALIGVLPLLGVSLPIAFSITWALALAYIVLALGVMMKGL